MNASIDDRVAIEELHTAWLAAELRGDTAALLALCAAAPVWLPPGGAPLCGRTAIREWLAAQPAATLQRIHIERLAISASGSFAWKTAAFRTVVDSGPGGGTRTVTGTHAWLLQRDDTPAWRIAVVTWTVDSFT